MEDVRSLLREWDRRKGQPTAVCIDSRTLQSTPESGARAGYDGAKRRKGSKVHIAVDTLGHLLALTVTPADQGDREQVAALAEQVQEVTGGKRRDGLCGSGLHRPKCRPSRRTAWPPAGGGQTHHGERDFVLLPRRRVVERSFAWAARFRRLARDYERLDTTLKGLHLLAFATLMLRNLANTLKRSS